MTSKERTLSNIASVRDHQEGEIAKVEAMIAWIGVPHDIETRLELERLRGDLSAKQAGLARTNAHYARVVAQT